MTKQLEIIDRGEIVAVRGNDTNAFTVRNVTIEPVAELVDLRADGNVDWYPIYVPVRLLTTVPQYTGNELWMHVALLIGKEIGRIYTDRVPDSSDQRDIRSQCYRLLGGNGIKIVQDVKDRVRSIIDAALV